MLMLTLSLVRGMATQRILHESDDTYFEVLLGAWSQMVSDALRGKNERLL